MSTCSHVPFLSRRGGFVWRSISTKPGANLPSWTIMEQSSNGWDVSSQRDLCDWSVSTRKERQVHEPLEECSGFTHGGTTKTSCGQRSMAGRGSNDETAWSAALHTRQQCETALGATQRPPGHLRPLLQSLGEKLRLQATDTHTTPPPRG